MTNSADPDQLASSEANWSGSTLFVKAGYIWVQQDKGYNSRIIFSRFPYKTYVEATSEEYPEYKFLWEIKKVTPELSPNTPS